MDETVIALLESVRMGQLAPAAAAMQLRERSAGYQQVCKVVKPGAIFDLPPLVWLAGLSRLWPLQGCRALCTSSIWLHARLTQELLERTFSVGPGICASGQLARAEDGLPRGRAGRGQERRADSGHHAPAGTERAGRHGHTSQSTGMSLRSPESILLLIVPDLTS